MNRDLKSLNIFLKNVEDIRVGNLGIAKILNQTFFAKTFIGTLYYLSPEICEDKPYNDKSDVWLWDVFYKNYAHINIHLPLKVKNIWF